MLMQDSTISHGTLGLIVDLTLRGKIIEKSGINAVNKINSRRGRLESGGKSAGTAY